MEKYRVYLQISVIVEAESRPAAQSLIEEAGIEITGENRAQFSDCFLENWTIYDEPFDEQED